jgi:hypothetical protein
MAQSPSHRFGQIIGDTLEAGIRPLLQEFARAHGLYLDGKGTRPCRRGKKCSWVDVNGNTHDLDFVLERGGSATKIGMPAACIEAAWRRYTKHSRNKAQELQGALEPLAETYRNVGPFKGAILAGVFTAGALAQLRSLGFTVIYFPYESVVAVFREFGVDASYDEHTLDAQFERKIKAYSRLSAHKRAKLAAAIIESHRTQIDEFLQTLEKTVARQIERIIILALHGQSREVTTIDDAIRFIEGYDEHGRAKPVERYEIDVRYNNGDVVRGQFKDKSTAIDFLHGYQPVSPMEDDV